MCALGYNIGLKSVVPNCSVVCAELCPEKKDFIDLKFKWEYPVEKDFTNMEFK